MNKRIKKKRAKNKVNLKEMYSLKNIIGTENEWDHCESFRGDLYKNEEYIISFYEHPVEGGYYPNGKAQNAKAYNEFINAVKKDYFVLFWDEWNLFDKGISELIY
ncbi:hypothetical protein [Tissierella sp.]|uniref:hypothetical protein n=1 Tax=Tissierella sp. TaxID=41274 RepID=UPI00305972EF